MKILVCSIDDWSLLNFRRDLVLALRAADCKVVCLAANPLDFGAVIGKNIEVIGHTFSRSLNPLVQIFGLLRLLRVMSRHEFDLIFSFTAIPNLHFSLIRVIFRYRFFPTVTGLGVLGKRTLIFQCLRVLYSWCLRLSADKVFFQSESDRSRLKFFKDKSVMVLGSGCPERVFHITRTPKSPRSVHSTLPFQQTFCQEISVGFGSRCLLEKGIVDFLKFALKISTHARNQFNFILTMSLDDCKSLVPDCILLEFTSKVRHSFIGFQNDISVFLEQVDLLTLPTTYNEGIPRLLLEAFASKTPVLSYQFSSLAELQDMGFHVWMTDHPSVDGIEAAINTFLSADVLDVQSRLENNQALVRTLGHIEIVNQKYLDVGSYFNN